MSPKSQDRSFLARSATLLALGALLGACEAPRYVRTGSVSAEPRFKGRTRVDIHLDSANVLLRPGPFRITAGLLRRVGAPDDVQPMQRFEDHVKTTLISDQELVIKSAHPEDSDWRIDLIVQVPDDSLVDIHLASGDVSGTLNDVRKLIVSVQEGDLDVTLGSAASFVRLSTRAGDVRATILDGIPSSVELDSEAGDIDLTLPTDVDVPIGTFATEGEVDVWRELSSPATPSDSLVILTAPVGDIRVR